MNRTPGRLTGKSFTHLDQAFLASIGDGVDIHPLVPYDYMHAAGNSGLTVQYNRGVGERSGTIGSSSAIANTIIAIPYHPGTRDRTIKGLSLFKPSVSSGTWKWGLYADTGNIFPGNILVDYGEISSNTSSGTIKSTEIEYTCLSDELYWIVIKMSAGSYIADTNDFNGTISGLFINGTSLTRYSIVYTDTYANALPATFSAGATGTNAFNIYSIKMGVWI